MPQLDFISRQFALYGEKRHDRPSKSVLGSQFRVPLGHVTAATCERCDQSELNAKVFIVIITKYSYNQHVVFSYHYSNYLHFITESHLTLNFIFTFLVTLSHVLLLSILTSTSPSYSFFHYHILFFSSLHLTSYINHHIFSGFKGYDQITKSYAKSSKWWYQK